MTDKEIIQVLRICATHIEKGCGLCSQMKYVRCTERLAGEAITMIERLTAENAELRKEIEWKDMVVALAQREQAKALDAADLIDRLTAENAALREKQRWIPVTERLPQVDGNYIVCTAHSSVTKVRFDPEIGRFQRIFTHWMPLPEAPKEGEKA